MTDKTVAIRVQMPQTLRAKFKAQCALTGKSMNEAVVELVEQWLLENKDAMS
ncbi:MAG: plasmid partition protein ParG [Cyanobacteria bacterium J06559_3]